MLLGKLGLLGNMLASKEVVRAGYGSKGEGIIRTGCRSKRPSFNFFFDSTTSFNKL